MTGLGAWTLREDAAGGPGSGSGRAWRAIVLPVAAQLCAAGIQIYALFHEIGKSERLVTLIVLAVATVQIIISRPPAPSGDSS